MKTILNRIFIILAASTVLMALSCSKVNPVDETEPQLEVNASNLHGSWTLTSINTASLPQGAYFHINFDRSGDKFQIWNAMNSIPSSYDYSEGTFKLYSDDPELGIYIRGIDSVGEEWSDLYVIKQLTAKSMVWIGVNDPTFIQEFTRIDTVPVQK